MRNRVLLLVGAMLAFASPTCAQPRSTSTPDETLPFKATDKGDLLLHVFYPDAHDPRVDRRPAIVFFFGGAWVGGSPTQFYDQCEELASRGVVAISAQYRTKKSHGAEPRECVADGKSAIRWVRAHAAELGVDAGRVAAAGGSAGGQVAAAAGNLERYDEPFEDASVSSRPNALVLFNPVFDNGPGGWGHGSVKDYWRSFSPLHNLDAQSPPTLVMLGDSDPLLPVATAREYQRRMEAAGVRCDVRVYAGQPHGFFNKSKSEAMYRQTLADAIAFLAELGYVPSDPATAE